MWEQFDLWKLLAGLGIFLFGMFLVEEALRNLAGRAFKRFIRTYTTGRIRSLAAGISVTAILQSSSAVSLMLLAFVGAGIMSMENAIGVILGSNIGTTFTGWIVAIFGFNIDIEAFALPFIGIGGLGIIFLGKSVRYSNISKLLVGFGFLFMGIDYMKGSVTGLQQAFDITRLPDYGAIVYALAGLALTALMQSSSASFAIVLTALDAGIISYGMGAAMVIGANMGTTVTVLLGSLGATPVKKRVAVSHFTFNFVTGILALLALRWLVLLIIGWVYPVEANSVIGLALFHTVFNVLGVVLFLPFTGYLTRLLLVVVPDRKPALTLFLQNETATVPEAAISSIRQEILHLIEEVLRFNMRVLRIDEKLVFTHAEGGTPRKHFTRLGMDDRYKSIKLLQAEVIAFAATVQSREMSEPESATLNRYLHAARMAIHAAKSLKDIRHNFEEFESADNAFLNELYANFRRRLIQTYLKLVEIMQEPLTEKATVSLFKRLKKLKEQDREYVTATTAAVAKHQISEIDISTALLVNREFIQSTRQIIFAIKDLLLTDDEVKVFEEMLEEDPENLEMP